MQLVAHRGNARDCPENTLPAFRSALALGARYLELDVQLTADRVPVVMHDPTFRRTAGIAGRIHDRTIAELDGIDAGEKRRFGARYRGTPISPLADVIGLLDTHPGVTLFVEIKSESIDRFGLDLVVRRVVGTIAPRASQCVVISFDLNAVAHARTLGHARVGWVLRDMRARSREAAAALEPEFLFVDHKKLPRRSPLWPGPWHWVVYEVATAPLARQLAARGITFIETMAVEKMLPLMKTLKAE